MARFGSLLAVAVGGALGSAARWLALSTTPDDRAALVVLAVNIVGCGLLGAVMAQRERLTDERFAFLGAGVAGGLTTFATFAVSVAQRLEDGELLSAAGIGLATMVLAVVMAGAGYRASRLIGIRLLQRRTSRRRRGSGGRLRIPVGRR